MVSALRAALADTRMAQSRAERGSVRKPLFGIRSGSRGNYRLLAAPSAGNPITYASNWGL